MADYIIKAGKDYEKKLENIVKALYVHLCRELKVSGIVQFSYVESLLIDLIKVFGPLDIWYRNDHRIGFGSFKGSKGFALFTLNYESKIKQPEFYVAGTKTTKSKLWPKSHLGQKHPILPLNKSVLSSGKVIEYLSQVKRFGDLKNRLPLTLPEKTEFYSGVEENDAYSKEDRFVFRKIRDSRSQRLFRDKLIDIYGPKCSITGFCPEGALEAAHIVPHSQSKVEDSFCINNGLLLRADIHSLLDRYDLAIDEKSLKLVIKNNGINDFPEYKLLEGKKLNLLKLVFIEEQKKLVNVPNNLINLDKIRANILEAYKHYKSNT